MPRLIQATITITRADLRAIEKLRHGIETIELLDLHKRMLSALEQAQRSRRTLNTTSRRLKKTAGSTP